MEYKKITIVDENDVFLGYDTYDNAVANNLIRRASRVFVFNPHGELLIQKRSQHISKPGLLDQSAAGHVDEGEEYIDAAIRETKEELGLIDFKLSEVVSSYRTEYFFNAIYKTVVAQDVVLSFDTHEVESVQWLSPTEVDELIANTPELCTEGLVQIWTELRDTLLA